jgi:hypothetical protein
MKVSLAFLDLLRQASKKDPEWQATRDAVLRKNENVEIQDNQSPIPRESMGDTP